MKTCDTCKWWDREYGCQQSEVRSFIDIEAIAAELVCYDLKTPADFGCTLHEEKAKELK